MRTSLKKGENFFQVSNKNNNLNITPFTPRKQLNFTSQKPKKYDIHFQESNIPFHLCQIT